MENYFLQRTGMIFGLHGVVFHGADARDAQKCAALQNHDKSLQKLMKLVLLVSRNSGQKNFRELKNEMLGIV